MTTSTDRLARLVARAEEAVRGIKDVEMQRMAFARILDHLLSHAKGQPSTDGVAREVAPGAITHVRAEQGEPDGVFADESQRTDALAEYFKVTPEQILDVFDVSNGVPSLKIRTMQLTKSKAEATREIALLMTGARTALGLDTGSRDLRETADDYGKLDSRNFMATLTDMPELSVLGKSGSPNRSVRMKVRGAEEAEALVRRLLNDERE